MNNRKLMLKKACLLAWISSILLTFTAFSPVMAQSASDDVQAKVNALLTSFVPNVIESHTVTSTVSFTHPGIGMSKTMLDNMRDHTRAADEPWASAFVQLSITNGKKPTMRIFDPKDTRDYVNIPSGGSGSDGYNIVRNMSQDAYTAYVQTIIWYITGDEVYRKNAMNLIREWSKVESIGSIYDEQERVSLAVYKFSFAAEILKSSVANTSEYDWTSADTNNYMHFLDLMKSKYDRYTHFMNQHGMCVMGYMASAIFRNDDANYAVAVQRATTNPELGTNYDFAADSLHNRDGSIISQIRAVTMNASTGETVPANIQVMEMGRDQVHPYADIGGFGNLAMTSYIQGTKVDPVLGTISTASISVNIFNFLDDRILAGANYLSKYNLGVDVTFIPSFSGSDGSIYSALTTADRGNFHTTIGIIYSYYKYIEHRDDMETNENTMYLTQAYNRIYPEGENIDYIGSSVLLYTLGQ